MAAPIRILCVDDDPDVLSVVAATLRAKYEVITTDGGEAGLEILAQSSDIGVVVSDMSMPGMDGITFLSRVRQSSPDISRILLTGNADLASAIQAVNEGEIFRFLTKPCPVAVVRQAVDAGVRHRQLIVAERELLEETLHGSIRALTEVLAIANPLSFGRATRVKTTVAALAEELGIQNRWQVEVAAMLSQLAFVALPEETAEKLYYGRDLSAEERGMVERLPALTLSLIGNIPRLEGVRDILIAAEMPRPSSTLSGAANDPAIAQAADLLRMAIAYDKLETQGVDAEAAIGILRNRPEKPREEVLHAMGAVHQVAPAAEGPREVPIAGLRPGMILLADMVLSSGMLLVSRGSPISSGLIERIRNLPRGAVREPVRVRIGDRRKPRAAPIPEE